MCVSEKALLITDSIIPMVIVVFKHSVELVSQFIVWSISFFQVINCILITFFNVV